MKNRKTTSPILSPSILVNLASLFVSLISFLNQIVLASLFGASISMDAYIVAISAPMMVSGVIIVTLGYSLVPILIEHSSDSKADNDFNSLLFISICLIAITISIAGYFLSPLQISTLGNDALQDINNKAIEIAKISWITAGAMIVVGYLRGAHNAQNKFILGTILSISPFIFTIIFTTIFHDYYGILSAAWGMLIGFILIIPILIFKLEKNIITSYKCIHIWKKVFSYLKTLPLCMISLLCFTVLQSVDAYWAFNYEEGGLTFLNYSQKLLVSIGGLIVTGPSMVIGSRLANAHRDGRIKELLTDNLSVIRLLVIFSIPVAILMSVLANEIIYVIFQRGKFNEYATYGVVRIFPIMIIGMVAMLPVTILFRALFSRNLINQASILGVIITALYFSMAGLFSYKLGYEGVAIAYTLTWWIALGSSLLVVYIDELNIILNRENYYFMFKLSILTIVTIVIVLITKEFIIKSQASKILTSIQILEILIITLTFYFTATINFINTKEIIILKNYFLRRI